MALTGLRNRCLLMIPVSVAACTQQSLPQNQRDVNLSEYDVATNSYESAGTPGTVGQAATDLAGADQTEDVVALNSWDLEGSAPSPVYDAPPAPSSDINPADARVWVGMSGVPEGCTLTSYKSIDDAALVLEQNGATILRKSPKIVVLLEHAPRGEFKSVFSTSEALCENVVASSGFAS